MTSPAQPDLSKLRINRDAPPPSLSRAVRRNVILGVVALILLIGAFLGWRRGSVVTVETVVAKPLAAGGSADNAGSSSVTANGYVVARTRASVSAKLPGPDRGAQGQRGIHAQEGRDHRHAGERRLPGAAGPGTGSGSYRPGGSDGGPGEPGHRVARCKAAAGHPDPGFQGRGRAGFRRGAGKRIRGPGESAGGGGADRVGPGRRRVSPGPTWRTPSSGRRSAAPFSGKRPR